MSDETIIVKCDMEIAPDFGEAARIILDGRTTTHYVGNVATVTGYVATGELRDRVREAWWEIVLKHTFTIPQPPRDEWHRCRYYINSDWLDGLATVPEKGTEEEILRWAPSVS